MQKRVNTCIAVLIEPKNNASFDTKQILDEDNSVGSRDKKIEFKSLEYRKKLLISSKISNILNMGRRNFKQKTLYTRFFSKKNFCS